jgi:hypothetical protein
MTADGLRPFDQRIGFTSRSSKVTAMIAALDAGGGTGRSGLVLPGPSDRGLGPRAVPDGYPPGRSRCWSRHAPHLAARTSPGAPAGATGSLVGLLCLAAFLADPVRTGLAMASRNRRARRRATLGIRAPQAEELQEPLDPQRRFELGVGIEMNPRPPRRGVLPPSHIMTRSPDFFSPQPCGIVRPGPRSPGRDSRPPSDVEKRRSRWTRAMRRSRLCRIKGSGADI